MIKKRKNNEFKRFILASKSPRRKEILSQVGIDYEVVVSNAKEVITSNEPNKVVIDLSIQKADSVYEYVIKDRLNKVSVEDNKEVIIIAADTVVAIDDNILGKPKDRQDAYKMISSIQGRNHNVLTGVTLLVCNGIDEPKKISFYEDTQVEIYPMEDEEIYEYIDTNEPYDKAGSYAIQGLFAKYVKSIYGDYYNVVGLPIARITKEIKNLNL